MKSSAYWKQRFEDLDKSLLSMGDQYYYDEVEKQFRLATREIEKEISIWYKRLAANNDISMADAKALLVGKDLQEFRWSVENYIARGQEYGISGKWAKELENASARVHITQLDALKLQMQQQLEVLYGNQVDGLDRQLKDIYSEGFYKTAYEVDKGIGVGIQLRQLDDNRLASVVSKPWCSDGKTFSDRLWRDKDALNSTLQREFSQAVIRGDGLGKVVQNVTKRMDVATSSAARLVATESAFFATASQRDCFSVLGVQQYQFVATLDDRTSDICQDMDDKVFDLKDLSPGTNAPPMHCWCRSCIVPYFGDNKGTRAARGESGKTEQVPGDMTYPEWKNTFVVDDITSKATTSASNNGIMKSRSSGTQSAVTKTQVVQIAGVNCVEKDLPNFSLSVGGKQGISKVRDCISYITPDNTRFIFPKNLNINKQSMTPERAIGLWMQVPEEIRTRSCGEIQFVDYYNPQDSYWRKIYKNFTRSYATGGGSNMTFYRCVRHNDDYVIKTFCHETGHYIDVQNTAGGIRYSASPQWEKAMHEDMRHSGKTSVTTYGENSPAEDFAESITEYEANAAQFEKDFPNRFKLIKAILTKGGGSP